jgi:autophagy-related protein 9
MFNQPTYFNQPPTNIPAVSTPQQQNYQSSHMTNDFERMLQQNLTDASTAMPAPLRGTFLHDISEDEDQQQQLPQQQSASAQQRPQDFGDNNNGISQSHYMDYNAAATRHAMTGSLRGGMSHREGPAEGSQGGLLHR